MAKSEPGKTGEEGGQDGRESTSPSPSKGGPQDPEEACGSKALRQGQGRCRGQLRGSGKTAAEAGRRQHFYGDRRLDFRALARRVLSERVAAGARAGVRSRASDLDRDQFARSTASQTPATFRKWARETPDGFVFSLKGPRFATNRRVLAEAGEFDQAVSEFRRHRARRPARPPALAIHADQEIRRSGFREVPRTAAGESRRGAAASCGRGAA